MKLERKSKFDSIRSFKTSYTTKELDAIAIHESVMRSYNILEYVKGMLKRGDSNETIINIIEELESDK